MTVSLRFPEATLPVVRDVSFVLPRGAALALVGESGSGKTLTALALLRLLPANMHISAGGVHLDGLNLAELPESRMRAVRGRRIAMVFQEPMTSLNPVLTIGQQLAEPLRVHQGLSRRSALRQAAELLAQVAIPAPQSQLRAYPHQLSGGMRQRVMIAMALACEPQVLIADEPTTALDVTIQAQVLALLGHIQRSRGMSLLLITHDLGIVARLAQRVCVMYAGRIVETADVKALLTAPGHPYTRALLECVPRLSGTGGRLRALSGEPASALHPPQGCPFHPRCPLAQDDPRCRQAQFLHPLGADQAVACWKVAPPDSADPGGWGPSQVCTG